MACNYQTSHHIRPARALETGVNISGPTLDGVPLEIQTINSSDPANTPGGVGSLTVLLPFASSLGATVFEIYVQDWQVAFDPTSPNYLRYGAGYRKVFNDTAAALGY
jgi:hypothetical protein